MPTTSPPFVPPVQTAPFGLSEDEALKQKLQGYQVFNYAQGSVPGGGAQPVYVYFRFPDTEIRTRQFPHITIDFLRMDFAEDRAHRADGYVVPFDLPAATPPSGYTLVSDDMPLPWTLVYQLSCNSRQPVHDRQLTLLMYQLFPEMYGTLDMTAFDGTTRRADLLGPPSRRDRIDQDRKRIYCQIFEVGISSEFFLLPVQAIQDVATVDVTYEVGVNSLPPET